MKFIPDEAGNQQEELPYYNEAKADDGWQGMSTGKSIETLRAEISAEIGRMDGTMTGWIRGDYKMTDGEIRAGVEIRYQIVAGDGTVFKGKIAVAALPYEVSEGRADSAKLNRGRAKKALRMGLYNVRICLQSTRILEKLSPGYAGLMPWLLAGPKDDRTISEVWSEEGVGSRALPPPSEDDEVVKGEMREVD